MKNNIEGDLSKEDKVYVIEDLISSGKNSLKAVQDLREFGVEVLALELFSLMDFKSQLIILKRILLFQYAIGLPTLIDAALKNNYISKSDLDTLNHWRKNPAIGKAMLKIKSDSIIVKSSAKKCVEYLCDLNNYQFLLPKDKINNWQSSKDFCIFSIQKAYTLDIVKESSNNDQILLKVESNLNSSFVLKLKFRRSLQIVVQLK